jgi:hypothetical protein
MASGQAWGGAIQNIGQAVGGTLADFARVRAEAPQRAQEAELNALKLAVETGKLNQQMIEQIGAKIEGEATRPDGTVDRELLTQRFRENGIGALLPPVLRELDTREQAQAKERETQGQKLFGATPAGPIQEQAMDTMLGSPEAQPHLRYSFGPGTADGPERMETPADVRLREADAFAKGQGGVVSPTGAISVPPQAPRPAQPTTASLAALAAQGDPNAIKALDILKRQRPAPASTGTAPDPLTVEAPTNPASQDIMGHAGLTYNGFLALTNPTRLPRDQKTRNAAAQEVQQWARGRGMDVATFQSQYKALNEVLEANINRFNSVKNIEGELVGSVDNLMTAAKNSGLNDVRAINAAKLWMNGELNDPQAADYAFSLRALISDIARYNAASSGRAPLESDMADARSVVQAGIATGSLKGLQAAVNRSVANMGTVLEGSVDRASQGVWNLFGVGDKYKPVSKRGGKVEEKKAVDPLGIRQ